MTIRPSTRRRLAAALALLGPASGFAQTAGFTDVFAPENWIFTSGGAPASAVWDDTFTSFTLTGSNAGTNEPSYTTFTVLLPAAYRVSFDWSYSTLDASYYDRAGHVGDGLYFQLSTNGDPQYQPGSTASPVYFAAGESGFYVYSVDNSFGQASLTISNFSFTLADPGDTGDGGGEPPPPPPPPPAGVAQWVAAAPAAWGNAANWSPSLPDATLDVKITGGADVAVTTAAEARSVYLDNSRLAIADGGSLTLADDDSSYFAADYGAHLAVTGPGSTFANSGHVTLYTATALFDQGAAVSTHGATLAFADDNIATVDLRNGATWDAGDVIVGYSGQATINIESGAQLVAGEMLVGYYETANGTVNVTGPGSRLTTGFLKIGDFGVGALNIRDGAQVESQSAAIAYGAVAGPGVTVGTVNVTGPGSRWTIAEDLGIGAYLDNTLYTTGSLTIADGALVKVGSDGTGTVNIDRGGSLRIGSGSLAGTLQAGGVHFEATSGTAPLLAFDHTDDVAFAIPVTGRGRVTKAGAGTLVLSGANAYTGTTTVSAGTLRFARRVSLYNDNQADWTASRLVVEAGATAAFNVGGMGAGRFTANNIAALSALGTATGGFKNGSFIGLDTTNAPGGAFAYSPVLSNPNGGANALGLVKLGAGTLTLSGANTYTGGTVVKAGTLAAGHVSAFGTGSVVVHSGASLNLGGYAIVNSLDIRGGALAGLAAYSGTQTVTGSSTYSGTVGGTLLVASGGLIDTTGSIFTGPVTIQSGGTLSGTGTLSSLTIQGGGILSPGNSPGLLTVNGDLILAADSTTLLEIGGLARGTGYDAIDISGLLSVGGTLSVSFIDGFSPSGPATFEFFRFTSFGGSFAQIDLPDVSGYTWNTSRLYIDGSLSLSAVPEPAAFAVLTGCAALGLAASRRRRRGTEC